MRKYEKKIYILLAVAAVLWFPTVQAQEITGLLNWKNGDVLPGRLLESDAGTIRWSSPYFLDDLHLDVKVLDSVVFRKPDAPPVNRNGQVSTTETFRVSTLSGDVWIADLIGSDNDTFLFSSRRHGQFRVKRSAVYMLERRERPDFLFDGSHLKNWKLPKPKREVVDPALPFDFVRRSDWFEDPEGHPKTWIDKAEIFYAFNWPEHFEIELELASDTHPPRFSFALGKDLYQTLRLEVWRDELVAVQGVLFKSVLPIQPEQRNLRLRLTYHEDTGVLSLFDATGNLLLNLEGIKPTVKEPGLYIQSRGEDLTVRNVKVYRQLKKPTAQRINLSKPHVYMTNGEKIQGRLFLQGDSAYVLDADGTRQNIDLQALNHIIQPGIPPAGFRQTVTLKYPDKVVLHGKLMQVKSDSVILQTTFADAPVTCSLSDAIRLQIAEKPYVGEEDEDKDKLFWASDSLRGRVVFGEGQRTSSIQWESVGALKLVRLADKRASHIERNDKSLSKNSAFDTAQFRHTLHLKSGEILPGQIAAYDGKSVSFQSPFISAQHLDATDLKALEFSGRTHAPNIDKTQPINDFYSLRLTQADKQNGVREVKVQMIGKGKDGKQFVINAGNMPKINEGQPLLIINEKHRGLEWIEIENRRAKAIQPKLGDGWIVGDEGVVALTMSALRPDPEKDKSHLELERALTVPRFARDNPPSHLLVAKTGDMKRGKLLDFQGHAIQFDSKFREFSIPIDRVARVVDVSDWDGRMDTQSSNLPIFQPKSEIRVMLTDGSILIFEPLKVQDGRLLGHSPIYGEVSIPVDGIESLYFGEKAKSFTAAFEKWTVRPAKEPTYDDNP